MYQPRWMLAVQQPYAVYRQGQTANSKGLQWITLSTLSCPDTLFMFRSTGRIVPQVTPRVKKYLWSPFWLSYVYFSAKAHQSYTEVCTKIKSKILKIFQEIFIQRIYYELRFLKTEIELFQWWWNSSCIWENNCLTNLFKETSGTLILIVKLIFIQEFGNAKFIIIFKLLVINWRSSSIHIFYEKYQINPLKLTLKSKNKR